MMIIYSSTSSKKTKKLPKLYLESSRMSFSSSFSIYAIGLVLVSIVSDPSHVLVLAYDNGLGLTPQMGWNPWNLFGCDGINETLIRDIASSMVSTGLSDLGYKFINLDDCWQVSRNKTGHIIEDFKKFPSGIGSLSNYIREDLGLKFGLYSDSGLFTCQRRPGSHGYEQQDAESYVEWRIDYLKHDNCFAPPGLGGGVQKRYETMRDALNRTAAANSDGSQKAIFFGLCEWGIQDPATWAGPVGNSWRTTGDIQKSWKSILHILDENDRWHPYAGPGGWNDPDMLQIGTTSKLTITEQRAHFTLWCLVKAPLLLANDLRDIPDPILEILSNPEVIGLNQDPLGVQGYKRTSSHQLEIWAGPLDDEDVAVVLFNRSEKTETITVRFEDVVDNCNSTTITSRYRFEHERSENKNKYEDLRNHDGGNTIIAHVRDLWAHSDLGLHTDEFRGVVPSHGVVALRLSHVMIERIQ